MCDSKLSITACSKSQFPMYYALTHYIMMEFPIQINTWMGLSIIYIKGSQVIISTEICILVPEDYLSKPGWP